MSNGITDDFFEVSRDPAKATGRLLYVGRLSVHKNVAGLLEALSLSSSKFGIDIVGDGECREELEELVVAKHLNDVVFHGKLRRDEIKHFYGNCAALVLPSFHEEQPMVLLEAMACRVPIVASKATAMLSTIDGSSIVIDPSVEGIANGIEEFARMDEWDIEAMVDLAHKRVKQLSWGAIIRSYVDLYNETLAN